MRASSASLLTGVVLSLIGPALGHASDGLPFGTWKATSAADGVRARLDAEVDDLIQEISVVYRPVARQLLRRAFQPCHALHIWPQSDSIAIQCDEQKVAVAAPDGRPVSYTGNDGRIHELSIHKDGSGLVQHVQGDKGSRTTRFALNGEVLMVDVTIQSPRLPHAIRYQLTYR